jgi:putative FmdB family regulatory protein
MICRNLKTIYGALTMPVYEFYCADCHAIFNFFSRRVRTDKSPDCPRCNKPGLKKLVSSFAISRNLQEQENGMPDLDESKMEQAMMTLAGEMDSMNDDDPKVMANFMRRFSNMTGINLGDSAEEALSRLEAGEDPEQVEADMGDLFDGDNLFSQKKLKGLKKRYLPPEHDDTLYSLD